MIGTKMFWYFHNTLLHTLLAWKEGTNLQITHESFLRCDITKDIYKGFIFIIKRFDSQVYGNNISFFIIPD